MTAIRHEVQHRHSDAADEQRRNLAEHQADRETLENGIGEDDARSHDNGERREQHGSKANGTGLDHGVAQREPVPASEFDEIDEE